MSDNLPPLPELGPEWTPYWTKKVHEQMQAYARAAIEADRVSRDVPAGWKLVPVEPTDEMILAFAQKECPADNSLTQDIRMFYSAMLAASPQPQPVPAQPIKHSSWADEMQHLLDSGTSPATQQKE